MKLWVLALAASVNSQADTADQFDLLCKETGVKPSRAEIARYRIDLVRGEWCDGECGNIYKIDTVTAGNVILSQKRREYPRDSDSINMINRIDGAWFKEVSGAWPLPYRYTIKGMCEPAPFSGMPRQKF